MANTPRTPTPVTDGMKKAGVAVLASSAALPKDELVAAIYRAMADAAGGSTRLAQDEVAAATVADGGGDERKKPKP
jgi:hypothetical protein